MTTTYPAYFFYLLALLRVLSLFISRRNEVRLRRVGAREFGGKNSMGLIITHIGLYIACLADVCITGNFLKGWAGGAGLVLYAFAIGILYYVIISLGKVWTMKLLIGPAWYHSVHRGFLFRWVRHPNYYLNLLPELLGIVLICQTWVAFFLFPVYLVMLGNRITLEEEVMKAHFDTY